MARRPTRVMLVSCSGMAIRFFPDDGVVPRGSGGRSRGVRRTGRDRAGNLPSARKKTSRPTGAPCAAANAVAFAPVSERQPRGQAHGSGSWPRSRRHTRWPLVRPGSEFTGIGFVVAGQVERDDPVPGSHQRFNEHRQVRALSAPTRARGISAAPSPHSSPATRWPSQNASTGLPVGTPGGIRRADSRTGGVHHNSTAQRDPNHGANRSSRPKTSAHPDIDLGEDARADDIERGGSRRPAPPAPMLVGVLLQSSPRS